MDPFLTIAFAVPQVLLSAWRSLARSRIRLVVSDLMGKSKSGTSAVRKNFEGWREPDTLPGSHAGWLMKQSRKGKWQKRHFWLLNEWLLYAAKSPTDGKADVGTVAAIDLRLVGQVSVVPGQDGAGGQADSAGRMDLQLQLRNPSDNPSGGGWYTLRAPDEAHAQQ